MSYVDCAAVGVVGDEDDTAGGGDGEGVWGERGEKGLEGFEDEAEMGWS